MLMVILAGSVAGMIILLECSGFSVEEICSLASVVEQGGNGELVLLLLIVELRLELRDLASRFLLLHLDLPLQLLDLQRLLIHLAPGFLFQLIIRA